MSRRSRLRFLDDIHRMAAKALAAGAVRVNVCRVRWDISGRCERPFITELWGRPSSKTIPAERYVIWRKGTPGTMCIELHTPCRKCEKCRQARAALWHARATSEIRAAPRTWFGSLTLSPENHFRIATAIAVRCSERVTGDFYAMSPEEQFRRRHAEISKELTKYLKRVRMEAGVPLRFLLVTEAHKSGLPHYHLLVHEASPLQPVRHKVLAGQWKLGFSNWKLADHLAPWYICKYISKSSLARVRASIDYGNPPQGIAAVSSVEYVDREKLARF